MSLSEPTCNGLLTPDDPAPVEVVNPDSAHAVLLVCEHAGREIPTRLGDLGLPPGEINRHIGWDIGAGAVSRRIAAILGSACVLQRYSRLVIDCNRPPHAPDAMPEVSDGTVVPANRDLGQAARAARVEAIFMPYDKALTASFARAPRRAAFSIHSFTPVFGGRSRPWDVGLLFRRDEQTSAALAAILNELEPALSIGMNEPYQVDDVSDWFVPVHCETRGLPHSLIEIRNDHIETAEGQERWATLLATAIARWLQET